MAETRGSTYGGVTYGDLYYGGFTSGMCTRWIRQGRGTSSWTRTARGESGWIKKERPETLMNILTQDGLLALTQDENYIMMVRHDSEKQARGTSSFNREERGESSWVRTRRPPCA